MVAGAIVAGATDLTYSLPGYVWVAICAVSTAVYLLLIRLLKDVTGQSVLLSAQNVFCTSTCASLAVCWRHTGCTQAALLYYNNVLALPMMVGYMLIATNEVSDVMNYPLLDDLSFQVSGMSRQHCTAVV